MPHQQYLFPNMAPEPEKPKEPLPTAIWLLKDTAWFVGQETTQVQRQGRYTPESNRHPAKMYPELARNIILAYSQPGELVLDPMSGIGTTGVEAIHLGRRYIGVEYEQKFVEMQEANLKLARQKGATAPALVMQGDARNLVEILRSAKADVAITPPPYGNSWLGDPRCERLIKVSRRGANRQLTQRDLERAQELVDHMRYSNTEDNLANLPYGDIDLIATSPPYANRMEHSGDLKKRLARMEEKGIKPNVRWERAERNRSPGAIASIEESCYSEDRKNLQNLAYGNIDLIATSPPYGPAETRGKREAKGRAAEMLKRSYDVTLHGDGPDNLAGLPYGEVDLVATSPPYQDLEPRGEDHPPEWGDGTDGVQRVKADYFRQVSEGNISRSPTYLEEILRVYRQCYEVLKPGGFLVVVTKDFRRDGQLVNLHGDTITLCLRAGFQLYQRVVAILAAVNPDDSLTPRASFWQYLQIRRLRRDGEPAMAVQHEDVAVFRKPGR